MKSKKGGNFEREISKILGYWWTKGSDDDIFWRTAGSGARATTRAKSGKRTINQDGDIGVSCQEGQPLLDVVTIELKRGYNWSIQELIDKNKKNYELVSFFEQCFRQKENSNAKGWWLIAKQDFKEPLIFFDTGFRRFLKQNKIIITSDHGFISAKGYKFTFLRLDDFLKEIDPDIFKK